MAVARSPWSKPVSGQDFDPTPRDFSRGAASTEQLEMAAKMRSKAAEGMPTTVSQEKAELQAALDSTIQRIAADPALDREQKLAKVREAMRIAANKENGTDDDGGASVKGVVNRVRRYAIPFVGQWNAYQDIAKPINNIGQSMWNEYTGATVAGAAKLSEQKGFGWMKSDLGSSLTKQALNQLAGPLGVLPALNLGSKKEFRETIINPDAVKDYRPSWDNFIKNASSKDWYMLSEEKKYTRDQKLSGFERGVTNFALQTVFDPLTYVGVGPATAAGRAGRTALATELLAKYGDQIPVDDIIRYGATKVPAHIREAEGIQIGLRFAGQIVPKTEAIEQAFAQTFGRGRAKIGDVIFSPKSGPLRDLALALTPKSAKGLVAAGAGRGRGLSNAVIKQHLSVYSAARYAKGVAVTQHYQWQGDVAEFGKQQRQMLGRGVAGKLPSAVYDAEAVNIPRYLEMPASQVDAMPNLTPELKSFIAEIRTWRDTVRNTVNAARQKFGADMGVTVDDIGFIDDYVHHRLTPEARRWLVSDEGAAAQRRGLYRGAEVDARSLTENTGPLMYRKLRGEYVDPQTGQVVTQTFFGKPVKEGTIDEINKIFGDWLESQGKPRMNWFETDLVSILDSYAYSMSKAMANIAYARRAWEFGGDIIKPLTKKIVPDEGLVASLTAVHDDLLKTSNTLRGRIQQNRILAKDYATAGLDYARKVLSGGLKKVKMNEKEVARISALLDTATQRLADAQQAARLVEQTQRGEFDTVHRVLLEQVTTLRAALDNPERYAATVELRNMYAAMYPNHNPQTLAGRSPEWIAEKILNANGLPSARELKGIEERMTALRGVIDSMPDEPALQQAREQLVNQYHQYEQFQQGMETLAEARMAASYSPDGLLYTTADQLAALPDEVGYKVLRADPNILDPQFATRADSVAVRAIPEDELMDLRNPDDYTALLSAWDDTTGEFTNPFAQAIADSLRRRGMGEFGQVFFDSYGQRVMTGRFDPLFEQTYPEVANLIDTIMFHSQVSPNNLVGDQTVYDFFNAVDDALRRVIDLPDDEVDVFVRELLDDAIGQLTHHSQYYGRKGIVMPQAVVDMALLEELPDKWAVLMPSGSPIGVAGTVPSLDPTAVVQQVADNKLVNVVMSDAFEEAWQELDGLVARNAAQINEASFAAETAREARRELRSEAGKKGAIVRGARRRVEKATEAAETLARTDTVEMTIGGQTQRVSRTQAQDQLARVEADVADKVDEFEKRIDAVYKQHGLTRAGDPLDPSGRRYPIERYGERLAMLMNEAKVLRDWNDNVAVALARDIQDLHTLLSVRPPKGAAAGDAAAWVRKVDRTLQSVGGIQDDTVRAAYERVTSLLHADEAQLAILEGIAIPNANAMMSAAQVGKMIEVTDAGWQELVNLGVQMPDELIAIWKPNLDKLRNPITRSQYFRAYRYTVDFFKAYATSTVGFFVRNGISATFMNHVAGVSAESTIDGFRAARAIAKGPEAWEKFLAKLTPAERDLYETAWRISETTGRGSVDELASPVLRGSLSEKVLNNAYTRAFRKKNEFVERAVRMPMALDSLRNNMGYDRAVARVTRYHFDYSDLSQADEVMRQIIPFWIWTSRNVPLQMTSRIMHPRAYAMYERIQESSPVGDEIMLPSWMAKARPLAIGGPNEEGGQWILMPDLPQLRLEDQISQLTSPKRLVGQLAPVIKLPIELGIANRQLGIDVGPFKDNPQPVRGFDRNVLAPIARALAGDAWVGEDPETGEILLDERIPYVAQNALPMLGQLNRTTGGLTGGRQSSAYEERQIGSILNWMGLPFRYVGPEQQRSEAVGRQFALQDYLAEQASRGQITPKDELPKPPAPKWEPPQQFGFRKRD